MVPLIAVAPAEDQRPLDSELESRGANVPELGL
jgi:hypothetical protein